MTNKNATMTATPDEIVTKLVEGKAAMKRVNGLAPDALLFSMHDVMAGRGGKVGTNPKRNKIDDKRDIKGDRKEKDLQKCIYCRRQGNITKNSISKQRGDPPTAADTAANAYPETTLTLNTSIENNWIVAS
jgi:hypothetical protein